MQHTQGESRLYVAQDELDISDLGDVSCKLGVNKMRINNFFYEIGVNKFPKALHFD